MGYTIENHSPKTETSDPPMYIYKKKNNYYTILIFVHKISEICKLSPFDFIFLSLFVSEYTHNNRQFILYRIVDKIRQSAQSIFFFQTMICLRVNDSS